MECDRFVEDRVGGAMSPALRDHLASCSDCRRDVEEYGEIRRLYREASVERYPGPVPRPSRWTGWIPAAAAALVMIGILLLTLGAPGAPPGTAKADPAVFHRIHLQPWAGEERIAGALDETWERIEMLERSGW